MPALLPPKLKQWAVLSVFVCFEKKSETRSRHAAVCGEALIQTQGTW